MSKNIKNLEYSNLQLSLRQILEDFEFEKGLNEVKKFLKRLHSIQGARYKKAGWELLNTPYRDENGNARLFIYAFLDKAKDKLKEKDDIAVKCAAAYIEEVMVPATDLPKQLVDVIFDDAYWKSKGGFQLVQKMQKLMCHKCEEMEEVCITALKDIVFNEPDTYRKWYFFTCKPNPITCKFSRAITNSQSLQDLVKSREFNEILRDREMFHYKTPVARSYA